MGFRNHSFSTQGISTLLLLFISSGEQDSQGYRGSFINSMSAKKKGPSKLTGHVSCGEGGNVPWFTFTELRVLPQ